MKLRKLTSLALALVMALSLSACGQKNQPSQSQSAGSQTPSSSSQPDPGQSQEPAAPELSGTMKVVATNESYMTLFDQFAADTGVKVELLSMSSGDVLSKLRAEGGTPSADLWFGGGIDAFMSAKADGLLEQVSFDASADLAAGFKDPEGFWFSKGITIVGFLVNNTLMDELKLTAPAT